MTRSFLYNTLIEFGPLTLFFFVSWIWGFYPGAHALVYSTLAALIFSIYHFRRFAWFSFSASTLVLVFGALTLWLHNPMYIVLEYSISNIVFGLALLGSCWFSKPLLEQFFGHMFRISHKGWMILTHRWGWVLFAAGVTNQVFWELIPNEDAWTLFRFFCTLAIFLFGISQIYICKRERLEDSTEWGLKK